MTDSRCVDPEYQLDVDVLILEYLLYQAIRAQFRSLRPQPDEDDIRSLSDPHSLFLKTEAERLLEAFDSFIQIFKNNHTDHAFTAGTSFNILLLETLVLLNLSIPSPSSSKWGADTPLSPDLIQQRWLEEQSTFTKTRRHWLQTCETHHRSLEPTTHLTTTFVDEDIQISSWTTFQETHIIPHCQNPVSPLFSVLNRFMALSAEISQVMRQINRGEISEKWIDIALELMLQSTLDLLSLPPESPNPSTHPIPRETNGVQKTVPGLKECFAFGFLPKIASSSNDTEISDTELLINEMFASSSHHQTESTQNPSWTQARSKILSEFHLPPPHTSVSNNSLSTHQDTRSKPSNLADATAYTTRLARLRHKYPFPAFAANLLRCLEHFWILNADVCGKPALVLIEEGGGRGIGGGGGGGGGGGLEGLNENEFERFLARVGLSRDEAGRVRLRV